MRNRVDKWVNQLSTVNKIRLTVLLSVNISLVPVLLLMNASSFQSGVCLILASLCGVLISQALCKSVTTGIAALEVGLLNFKDGEFSSQLAYNEDDELGRLCDVFNETSELLRQEKQWIYQRELMLDKVLQSSPQALILIDESEHVVFSNHSAQKLFAADDKLEGMCTKALYEHASDQLVNVMEVARDGLFHLAKENDETQTWHLSTGQFLLNNHTHRLYIFKQMTRELSRQEVAVWKKVIRVISHELNNSLGPMSSMLHSGKILSQNLNEPRLGKVFSTLQERINHLNEFVQGYGKFAKLPQPKLEPIDWLKLLDSVNQQWSFNFNGELPAENCLADTIQLEQLMINLVKNAHESGSDKACIQVLLESKSAGVLLSVMDAGPGMNEAVMANALVPFYSTKQSGTGLGLALCREIAEAHHGHLSLHNRAGSESGLIVQVFLPK